MPSYLVDRQLIKIIIVSRSKGRGHDDVYSRFSRGVSRAKEYIKKNRGGRGGGQSGPAGPGER